MEKRQERRLPQRFPRVMRSHLPQGNQIPDLPSPGSSPCSPNFCFLELLAPPAKGTRTGQRLGNTSHPKCCNENGNKGQESDGRGFC